MNEEQVELFKNEIGGKYDPKRLALRKSKNDVSIGAKVRGKFDEFFREWVADDYKCTHNLSDGNISDALNRFNSVGIPGFPSIDSFLNLISPKQETFRQPTFNLQDKIH